VGSVVDISDGKDHGDHIDAMRGEGQAFGPCAHEGAIGGWMLGFLGGDIEHVLGWVDAHGAGPLALGEHMQDHITGAGAHIHVRQAGGGGQGATEGATPPTVLAQRDKPVDAIIVGGQLVKQVGCHDPIIRQVRLFFMHEMTAQHRMHDPRVGGSETVWLLV